jgi:hypothetical protein
MSGDLSERNETYPAPSALKTVFKKHHCYYESQRGETALLQRGDEQGVRRAHAGRVIFELLQNALDRAEAEITIKVVETPTLASSYALVVTNDGLPISVDPEFDYRDPPEEADRPDFNALCSVHLSNKSPDESVGNKGVGFRSVFWLNDWVRVWSRHEDGWWGMELHSHLDDEIWSGRLDSPDVRRGHEKFLETTEPTYSDIGTRPSYHFPLPLMSEGRPSPIPDGEVTTGVVVPIPMKRMDEVSKMMENLRESHLHFAGLFEHSRGLTVRAEMSDRCFERRTWPTDGTWSEDSGRSMAYWRSEPHSSTSLAEEAAEADYDLSNPGAAISWPGSDAKDAEGKLYGYLPTELDAPFGVDFNGDFLLQPDRKGLTVEDDSVGRYNQALLEAGAELHLLKLLEEVGVPQSTVDWTRINPEDVERVEGQDNDTIRRDFWSLLDPGASGIPARRIEDHLAALLFGDDMKDRESYELWAQLADQYFRPQNDIQTDECDRFWRVSRSWLDHHCGKGCGTVTLGKYADALCDALRERETPLIPVESEAEESVRVPLPTTQSGRQVWETEKSDRVLFVRDDENDRPLPLPTSLREAGCSVTTFEFPSLFVGSDSSSLGERSFNPVQLLSEIRQLRNSPARFNYQPLAEDADRAASLQRELIGYAAELFLYERYQTDPFGESDGYGMGWRFLSGDSSSTEQRAGRSIATLHLPVGGTLWAPARQLTIDQVDIDRLGDLPQSLDIESFLLFLGCGPEPPEGGIPLTLIEGGQDAIVDARAIPPTIVPAETRPSAPTIPQLSDGSFDDDRRSETTLVSIADAWDVWLSDLIEQEIAERRDEDDSARASTNLVPPLAKRPWFPVQSASESTEESIGHAEPPRHLSDAPAGVAPRDVVVLPTRSYGRKRILWSVDQGSEYEEILTTLGALDGISEGTLERNDAAPARRLADRLQNLDLTSVEGDSSARDALIGLYERVLQAIVSNDSAESRANLPPLLTYHPAETSTGLHERPLEWRQLSGEPAYIITNSDDRDQMRRIFHSVPLVTAVLPSQSVDDSSPLQSRLLTVNRQVRFDETDGDTDDRISEKQETIERLLPRLLALSEAVRRLDMDSDIIDRWYDGRFQQVEDAWVEYTLSANGRELDSVERYRGEDGNAFFVDTDAPTIVFDGALGESSHDLTPFGEALANLLFEDQRQVGILFERALTEYDHGGDDRLDRFVDRKDAGPLVGQYVQLLYPLDEAAKRNLFDATRNVLGEFDLTLDPSIESPTQLSSLGPTDIVMSECSDVVRDEEINRRFNELDLTKEQDRFRPRFSCSHEHYLQWQRWFDGQQPRLVTYLVNLVSSNGVEDADEETVEQSLEEFIDSAVHRLTFDPSRAVVRWLSEADYTASIPSSKIPDSESLADEIRRFSPRYKPISKIEDASDAGWTRDGAEGLKSHPNDNGTFDRQEMARKHKAQKIVGDEAEVALLDCVRDETLSTLEHADSPEIFEAAREALLSPFPEGATRSSVREAWNEWRSTGDDSALARGLHISRVWDGAGFDLVGLAHDDDGFRPVRYEAKALSGGPVSNVHLSANQISVYRRVCLQSDPEEAWRYQGDWRLVGVLPDESAINLNGHLDELPDLLDELDVKGFTHDGIVLRINRRSDDRSSTFQG